MELVYVLIGAIIGFLAAVALDYHITRRTDQKLDDEIDEIMKKLEERP